MRHKLMPSSYNTLHWVNARHRCNSPLPNLLPLTLAEKHGQTSATSNARSSKPPPAILPNCRQMLVSGDAGRARFVSRFSRFATAPSSSTSAGHSPLHPSNSFPSLTTCRLLACVHRPAGNFHGLLRRAATASFPVTCPRGHCCCQGTRSCVGGKGQGTTRGGKKIRGDAPQPSSRPCSVERNVVEHQWPGTRRGDAAFH